MSLICLDCIGDDYLKNTNNEDELGYCHYCENREKKCIKLENLSSLLDPVGSFYTPVESFMSMNDLKKLGGDGRMIWDALQEDWRLFPGLEYGILEELFYEMYHGGKDESPLFLSSFVEVESDYYGDNWEITEILENEWNNFCREITQNNRFFPQRSINLELLSNLFFCLEYQIHKDSVFYRARISNEGIIPCESIGKPPKEICPAGRANPIGIPYLYVASTLITAISEIEPIVTDKVTVGELKTVKSLKIIDLRNPRIESPFRFGYELSYFTKHLGFLIILGEELSKPINPKNAELEYVPLQYLCEFIKNEGYDGVAYHSTKADGYNLGIFSDNKIKCQNTKIFNVGEIRYEINES